MYPVDIRDVFNDDPTSDTNVTNAGCTCKLWLLLSLTSRYPITRLRVSQFIGTLLITSKGELPIHLATLII